MPATATAPRRRQLREPDRCRGFRAPLFPAGCRPAHCQGAGKPVERPRNRHAERLVADPAEILHRCVQARIQHPQSRHKFDSQMLRRVITRPAPKAGGQDNRQSLGRWIPAFAGMTNNLVIFRTLLESAAHASIGSLSSAYAPLPTAADRGEGSRVDRLEQYRVAGGKQRRRRARGVEKADRRGADQVPPAGALIGIDRGQRSRDRNRAGGNPHPRIGPPRQGQRRRQIAQIGKTGQKPQHVDVVAGAAVQRDDLFRASPVSRATSGRSGAHSPS